MQSRLTYNKPKERYEQIANSIIDKFDFEVVGIYCKLVRISSGKSLSIDFISARLGINSRRLRKTIVLLEEEGYITREPLYSNGRLNGWNYQLYAEPVKKENRTHAGKPDLSKNSLDKKQSCQKTDKTENGQDNNIYTNRISINNKDLIIDKEKVLSDDNTKSTLTEKEYEEQRYNEAMKKRYPHIMRMDQPLTLEQAKKLKGKFNNDLLQKIMDEMENWKPLLKKCVSAYMTINNWCNRELERS